MSRVKISELPPLTSSAIPLGSSFRGSAADSSIFFPVVEGTTTKKISIDSVFQAAGEITASGNISSSGTIIGSNLSGTNTGDQNISNLAVTGSNVVFGDITASFITSSGGLATGPSSTTTLNSSVITLGASDSNRVNINSFITTRVDVRSHITASGNISSSGTIEAAALSINGTPVGTSTDTFWSTGSGNKIFYNTANVGIGSSDPSNTLTVGGEISASGDITTHGDRIVADKVFALTNTTSEIILTSGSNDRVVIRGKGKKFIFYSGSSPTNNIVTIDPTGGHLTASGDLIATNLRVTGDVTANSGSFQYITSSVVDVDANTIRIGGTSFSKSDLDDLKGGKSISTNVSKQVVHAGDDSTFVQMKSTVPGRVIHKVSDVSLFDMSTSSFQVGSPSNNVPMTLQGSTIAITGSTSSTGSFNQSGSLTVTGSVTIASGSGFTFNGTPRSFDPDGTGGTNNGFNVGGTGVVDLLNFLSNFGNADIPTGSEAIQEGVGGVAAGDINLDGQVNITDLLLLLSGYGNPTRISTSFTVPQNTNYQLIGPEVSISGSLTNPGTVKVTVANSASLLITGPN